MKGLRKATMRRMRSILAETSNAPRQRPTVIPCNRFKGRSQKTGKLVGERHRWPDGWGKGQCEYCGRYLEQVQEP